jgi:hypothetical protein
MKNQKQKSYIKKRTQTYNQNLLQKYNTIVFKNELIVILNLKITLLIITFNYLHLQSVILIFNTLKNLKNTAREKKNIPINESLILNLEKKKLIKLKSAEHNKL